MTDVTALLERIERRLRKVEKQVDQHLSRSVVDLNNRDKALLLLQALRIKRMVANIGPVAIGTTTVPITWPVPFGDELYWVGVEVTSGAAGFGTIDAQLTIGSRTPEGCEITVVSTAVVGVAFLDVIAIRP